ncbi:MAG: hypothetical protein Nkreftii_001114 [Candidatus Nitrospira kreftii]|uniref:Uncharacterized protein n=1 Tax=Candidatus Nitrospira kreftii TaxID=2652173 RepID=A0A7S8FCK4_9BACT|nr:MAG: hypothetical protein Nkreftii_001114 [Candidatus Nitrospira kreftii]
MPKIVSQEDCRKVRDLPFCYLCGKPFDGSGETNDDHVPPQSIFAPADRNFPIKLKAHKVKCHAPLNLDDEIIGQLIALRHGKKPSESNNRMKNYYRRKSRNREKYGAIQRAEYRISPSAMDPRISRGTL